MDPRCMNYPNLCRLFLLFTTPTLYAYAASNPSEPLLEEITITGTRVQAIGLTGAGHVIEAEKLRQFNYTDIQQIVREIPGVSVQVEDGYGLRPNLSIRGTATERSGRITLLEDNVLIAPAPYSAPSAYYFPTAGRMSQVEVLKGSSAIKQGPYTVGGAMNFLSTDINGKRYGHLNIEAAQHNTQRFHGTYSDRVGEHFAWLVEGHLWNSDGFQDIDQVGGGTGLDKDDWMAKFRINTDKSAVVYQQLDFKFQYATENSDQSYLGLTDTDFNSSPFRRYAASQLDNIDTEHDQVIVRYLADFRNGLRFTTTAYNNNHQRDWFKTEGLDPDGSINAQDFDRISWFNVIQAANRGEGIGGLSNDEVQAVLDGENTMPGAIQVRSNAREYFSRGIQLGIDWNIDAGSVSHELEIGIRYHEDEEDRLQRNSTYRLENGDLVLDDQGLLGNAGNRIQEAQALSVHLYDTIRLGSWTLTPGLRYEDIEQSRVRWETRDGQTLDPSSRDASNLRDTRDNNTQVLIPGIGAHYALNDQLALYGGVHKGFAAPSNAPDVHEEESINYELGFRFSGEKTYVDTAIFVTDYDNILGECTASSGSDCEVGDAFNGDAASIAGLELLITHDFANGNAYSIPVSLSYTHLNGEFDSDIADTDFFGDVSAGDPLPYIPDNQFLLSLGYEVGAWATYLNANYVDEVCVRASCDAFERTEDSLILDLAANYRVSDHLTVYGRIDNVTQEEVIVARQPYGARPNKDQTIGIGLRLSL